ncbi:MAG: hypothetical protein QOI24_1416 [Acidobacteriota bacterium]|jgi:hypothetical protein|nr:hypothetical protein [Acidobacteriota bacterium]
MTAFSTYPSLELPGRIAKLTAGVAANASTVAVLLVGSLARGEAKSGSDIDLYAITDASGDAHEDWRFAADGVMEDVHWLPLKTLPSDLTDRGVLIDWLAHNTAADHLVVNRVLYIDTRRAAMLARLWELVRMRADPTLHGELAAAHAMRALTIGEGAIAYAKTAPLQAHQTLRHAMQALLEASLIRLGWTLRGSKRRPETAHAYRRDVLVAHTLDLLEEVVGLSSLTIADAGRLARQRLAIRGKFTHQLRRFAHDASARAAVRREENAIDYYSDLVATGFHRGAVNHMRALAGFDRIPHIVLKTLGSTLVTVDDFLRCSAIQADLRNTWAAIADLGTSELDEWWQRLTTIAEALREEAAE